ncbi:MAG TPA: hypothetical protein VG621_00785 [Candidatus Paceibacterota bacterium]|nr:hypothetical protein [Candidatus Paceibacterota bacterium]
MKQNKNLGIGIATLLIIGVIIVTFAHRATTSAPNQNDAASSEASLPPPLADATPATVTTEPSQPSATPAPAPYKNGTYTLTTSYMSPGGTDKLGVSLTLSDGIITDATVTPLPSNRTSAQYQSGFIASYKSSVIGKSIASLSIAKVAGASLTTASFNEALATIRTQASA